MKELLKSKKTAYICVAVLLTAIVFLGYTTITAQNEADKYKKSTAAATAKLHSTEADLDAALSDLSAAESERDDAQYQVQEFESCVSGLMNLRIMQSGKFFTAYVSDMSSVLSCFDGASSSSY